MIYKQLICAALLVISFSALADNAQVNLTHTFSVKPDSFKNPVEYQITLPEGYFSQPDKKYNVLLAMHPRSHAFVSGLHDWLSHNGQWPWLDTIIVSPNNYNPEFIELFKLIETPDKAKPLLDFLDKQLLHQIDKKYRTNGFRMFHGFRGDGTLGLFTLFHRPDLFNAYFLASPNLANDFASLLSDSKTVLPTLTDKPRFLLISTGNHKYEQPDLAAFERLTDNLDQFAPSILTVHVKNFDQHYFMTQPVMNLIWGIEKVFDEVHNKLPANSPISKQGANAIIAHYRYLSEQQFGFPVSPVPSLLAQANYLLAQTPADGLAMYKVIHQHFPQQLEVVHGYAQAWFEYGDISKAIDMQKQAVELAHKKGQWYVDKQQAYLQQYKQHIN